MQLPIWIFANLFWRKRRQMIALEEQRRQKEWEMYEDFREENGFDRVREKIPKHKSRPPAYNSRKKHRL